ncbi:NhaP-type Na+/H+ or K+/H+ antiporter [Bacillus ectoiniformans]|nr:NhaP-type Na+/H+ or K+/H+ antiporter [Bacillus ectoiniformans]
MIIGLIGVVSQWIAWRFRMPAIVVMSLAGLAIGPMFGLVNPKEVFGDLFKPFIAMAVAIILFEGSLNLDFREIRGIGRPITRIVTLGAFIAWILGSLGAHYVAGLSWAVAFVIGGLFIVTGPTVILPLLRQAKLKPRTAAILKWEGIVVDPFGALLAVFAFEFIQFLTGQVNVTTLLLFLAASTFAVVLGWALGKSIGIMLERGHIPEYLKSPIVLVAVIACFAISDEVMHETGLLAVTAMGMVMANMHISSINDMRHFKENISILLISTIFVMLTASLSVDTLKQIMDIQIILFVLLMLFVVRPLSIWVSTIGTDLTNKEKALVGWIAPRGIVALTVSSYFASSLLEAGYEDAKILTSLTFALVFATVCAHGFSIGWLAQKLGLAVDDKPGVLLVGSSNFSVRLAKTLDDLNIPVLIADASWQKLHAARTAGVPTYFGEVLSEQTEYHLDMNPYEHLIAATDDDAYNALVCNTFIPEIGRNNLYQLNNYVDGQQKSNDFGHTIGGRSLFTKNTTWLDLNTKVNNHYVFRKTELTEQYTYKQYLSERDDSAILLFILKSTGKLEFYTKKNEVKGETGDVVVSLSPPSKEINKIKEKIAEQRNGK